MVPFAHQADFGVAPFPEGLTASRFSGRALVPMTFRKAAQGGRFAAGGEHCELGELSLTYMWSRGRYVATNAESPPASDDLLVTLCLHGSAEIQSRAPVVIASGEIVILPCAGALTVTCDAELATLSARMPVAWLLAATGGGPLDALLCRPICAEHGMAGVLADTLRSFWRRRQALDRRGATGMADVLGRLLRAAIEESWRAEALTDASPTRAVPHQPLFWKVHDDIRVHLGRRDRLDVKQTARRLGRSVRAVQAALQAGGTTFGAMVMEARLVQAEALLRSPMARHRSITELALELGFEDLAHFSRRFRARYGLSPRAYRAAPQ